jgi:hypothetical protein
MDHQHIAQQIIELKYADLRLRNELTISGQLSEGYHEAMETLHNSNAKALNELIDEIGYPTITKVGREANEAAWLIIQHAIAQPAFMKKSAKLLEIAVNENEADAKSLAYLSDRIAVFEGKPQLYGTQFDWDEEGDLSPNLYHDLTKVNERRKRIGLNTLEAQTALMNTRAKKENQSPPANFEKRRREFEAWKKAVGWIR